MYVHTRKATHAKQNNLAGLATKKKKKKKEKKQQQQKNGDTVGLSHLHTWRQDGWLSQQISPFFNFNTPQCLWFVITRCPQTDYM